METIPTFIIDECTGSAVAKWMLKQGYDTISIYDEFRGLEDVEILKMAVLKKAIIITNDKDFGEMIFKQNKKHHGIILLRLNNERSGNKIEVLKKMFETDISELIGNFIVVTDTTIRIIKDAESTR